MLVGDVLNLVAQLSIGLDTPTVDDQNIFLNYLNLAHFELFSHVAMVNPTSAIQTDQLNVNDGVCDALTMPIFGSLIKIYRIDTNRPLISSSLEDILEKDPGRTIQAQPKYYYYSNNVLNVWPLWTALIINDTGIGAIYNTQPTPFNLNSDLATYYPLAYHQILVDGTCYYMFQTESGFKNSEKMATAAMRWQRGKTNLYQYYVALSGKTTYSTYSKL